MIPRTSILALAAKLHKPPNPNQPIFFRYFLFQTPFFSTTPSSSSSDDHCPEIPARLRHKDWLSPAEAHRVFASLGDPGSLVLALDHYAKRKDYKPTEALFTLVLARLARAQLFRDADVVFERATAERTRCRLSDGFFRGAIEVFGGSAGRVKRAVEILFDMPRKYGFCPSSETFSYVLNLLVSARMFDVVYEVFVAAPRLGVAIDSCCLNVMVKGLCECGKLDVALQMLDEFPHQKCEPNGETFVTLMRYFCFHRRIDEAFGLFERMEEEGIEPDTAAFNVLIGGLGSQGRVDEGMALLETMRLKGCEPDAGSYQEVFSGLVATKRFPEAKEFMRKVIGKGMIPSFKLYRRLIRGLCEKNRMEDVDWALEEMTRQGFVPNMGMWREILESLFSGKSNHKCVSCEQIIAN